MFASPQDNHKVAGSRNLGSELMFWRGFTMVNPYKKQTKNAGL
jgi:hypothetical protein